MNPICGASITQLLEGVRTGEADAAESLLTLVYPQLRGLAGAIFSTERPGHTLQPTALINEAWMKMSPQLDRIDDRVHFFAVASRAMRQVLVDHARHCRRQKRGGEATRVPLEEHLGYRWDSATDFVDLDDSLTRLAALNARHARVVELRILGGLTIAEAAVVLGVSHTTIEGDWFTAKAWLRKEFGQHALTREADHYARIHEILRSARALTGERLDAYLAGACGSDRSLESEVLELLAAGADENADDAFADRNVDGVRRGLQEIVAGASSAWCPEKIGEYTILRQIGCGGMGVVYEAQQASPRRRVAIKLLHPMHATADRVRRFHHEAEVLGRLQHPGIAQIFEAGTYDIGRGPQPFFAMELVDGLDIRTHCARSGLDHATRIELLARVADAVQYAHDRNIIHRDLKPDNVIVDPNGQPRILDFGIARLTSHSAALSSIVTEAGQLVGTLAYMAPEQLSRRPDAITARVDVYALGVLGFELLVGRPLHAIGDLSISQAITLLTSSDPTRAGTIDASLRGDVETILGKALEADPERRYPSAAAFAGDLRRFLAHLPIQARSPSGIYLARKFVRRHRALVAGMVATVLALLAGVIAASVLAHRASVQRDLAIANVTLARRNETRAINGLLQSTQFLLDAGRGRDAAVEVRLVPEASRGVAWRLLDRAVPFVMDTRPGHWRFVDDEHLVRVLDDRVVLYSLGEHRTVRELFIGAGIRSLGSPATCGIVPAMSQDEVLLLDLGRETVLERSPRRPDALGADGAVLPRNDLLRFPEVSDDGRTVLWYTSESEAQVRVEGAVVRTISDLVAIETAHLGPDGKLLLVNRRAEVCVLDVATGAVRFRHAIEPGKFASGYPVRGGALLVDALDIRSSDLRDKMGTWDVRRVWRRIAFSDDGPPEGPVDPFSAGFVVTLNDYAACELHYPRDGRFVAISDRKAGSAHLGDTQTGAPLLVRGLTTGHGGTDGDLPFVDSRLSAANVSPSGCRLAVFSDYAQTMIVELDPRVNDSQFDQRCLTLRGHGMPSTAWIYHVAVSNDGSLIASSAPLDPLVRVWDARTGECIATLERVCTNPGSWDSLMAFGPGDDRLLVTTPYGGERGDGVTPSRGHTVRLLDWNLLTGEVAVRAEIPEEQNSHLGLLDAFVDAFIDALGPTNRVRLSQRVQMAGNRAIVGYFPANPSLIHNDGWLDRRPVQGRRWYYIPGLQVRGVGISVHPTAAQVAVVQNSEPSEVVRQGKLVVRDTSSGAILFDRDLDHQPWCVAYSPDGSVLAIGTNRGRVLIFETESYTQQLERRAHESYVYSLAWTPDGTRLVTASGDATLRIWDTRTRVASLLEEDRWKSLRAGMAARDGLREAFEPMSGSEREAARVELIRRVKGGASQATLNTRPTR